MEKSNNPRFRKMKRYLTIFLFLGVLVPAFAEARIYFDINAPTFVQIPIVLAKWKSVDKTPSSFPEKVYQILANDLTLSGFFKVIDASRLPPSLRERDGIPSASALQEWTPA